MTLKEIKFAEKKEIETLEVGDIVKQVKKHGTNDLFIVAKLNTEETIVHEEDPIARALFGTAQSLGNNRNNGRYYEARRTGGSARYNLVSLTRGVRLFGRNMKLTELVKVLSEGREKFELVERIEIKEV